MKIIPILFAICLVAVCPVRPSYASPPTPEATQSKLSIKTADITDIEVLEGTLLFSVDGRRYSYTVKASDEGSAIAGGLAILAELRRATTASLWVSPGADPKLPVRVESITFNYPSLKQ